ncbi:MAG: hypothetical protein K6E51_11310 [Treponema sp.]|nr:hypothetical protein [Treponema sp.]
MIKKLTEKIVCVLGLLLLSVSCSQNTKSGTVNDTVRINISSDIDSMDPWKSAAADTISIFRNVFEGLLKPAVTSGDMECAIAESYEISDDYLTYTFHLTHGVTFHNGTALTSKDVLYTYEHLAGLHGCEAVSAKYGFIADVAAPDDYTFVVTLKNPDPFQAAQFDAAIVPVGYDKQATDPIGAGPYRFDSYVPGQKIVFSRYDGYYKKDALPKIATVEVYIMTSTASVIAALKSNQLDIAYFINGSDAVALKNSFTILTQPQNMVQLFGLNNKVPALSDKRVRQAITYAINKKDIIDGVWNGYATELYSNFSPVMSDFYNDTLSSLYSVDVAKAKSLLEQAGYANGFSLTITVPSNYEPHVSAAQIIVSQLHAVGIDAKIESVDWATWLDKVYTKADYEATVIAFVGKQDPHEILGRYTTGYKRNFICYSNPEYDACIKAGLLEKSKEKRAFYYKEAQRILAEDAASVYICDPNLINATRKDLHGYQFYPITFIDFSTLYYE